MGYLERDVAPGTTFQFRTGHGGGFAGYSVTVFFADRVKVLFKH